MNGLGHSENEPVKASIYCITVERIAQVKMKDSMGENLCALFSNFELNNDISISILQRFCKSTSQFTC